MTFPADLNIPIFEEANATLKVANQGRIRQLDFCLVHKILSLISPFPHHA